MNGSNLNGSHGALLTTYYTNSTIWRATYTHVFLQENKIYICKRCSAPRRNSVDDPPVLFFGLRALNSETLKWNIGIHVWTGLSGSQSTSKIENKHVCNKFLKSLHFCSTYNGTTSFKFKECQTLSSKQS